MRVWVEPEPSSMPYVGEIVALATRLTLDVPACWRCQNTRDGAGLAIVGWAVLACAAPLVALAGGHPLLGDDAVWLLLPATVLSAFCVLRAKAAWTWKDRGGLEVVRHDERCVVLLVHKAVATALDEARGSAE
jgi:hypothetical protein